MWAVILSSFVTGAAGIMRAAYSPSLTVPVRSTVRGRSLPSLLRLLSAYQGDRVRYGAVVVYAWWPK
jgi:hypothetical protein